MKFESECHQEKDNLGDVDTDGRIILRWILKKEVVQLWIEFIFLKTGPICVFFVNMVINLLVRYKLGHFLTH